MKLIAKKKREYDDDSLLPLVNIIFLLLIFFMIAGVIEKRIVKDDIVNKDPKVEGFNLGTNIGKVSGQSIFHCHFHLIPRRTGDVDNPQGGVRSVIPNKQHYKRKK